MTIDPNELIAPLTFMAIGALTELIALKHPTPGERVGIVLGVLAMGAAGFLVPAEMVQPAIVGFLITEGGRLFGLIVARAIDKIRVWRANANST